MTQPIRLKVTATSSMAEKPPSIDMKIIIRRVIGRCIPCIKFKNNDEKVPLTPRNPASNNEYDN